MALNKCDFSELTSTNDATAYLEILGTLRNFSVCGKVVIYVTLKG